MEDDRDTKWEAACTASEQERIVERSKAISLKRIADTLERTLTASDYHGRTSTLAELIDRFLMRQG